MKKLCVVFFSLVLSSCIYAGETNSFSLYDALQQKLVMVVIKGRGTTSDNTSAHYGKCISLNVKNICSKKLELKLEAGRKLKCYKDSVQTMMVSQTEIFALAPGNTCDFTINAFCTRKSSASPGSRNVFNMQDMAGGYLLELTQLIESLGCQDNMGQQAVWAITDGVSPENIKGGDPSKAKKLKDFVEFAIKRIKSDQIGGYIYDYSFPDKTSEGYKIAGEINWDMPYSGTVTLSVYDNKGKKMLDIFTGVPYNSGFQSYDYKLANTIFREGETYWLKVVSGGQWLKEVAITMK
ncbi:MAG TPA: hypothetical protein PKW80_13090 [Bacteroidales bacterium]|nr:hypothetical protein [Bacteroidales bacterium]